MQAQHLKMLPMPQVNSQDALKIAAQIAHYTGWSVQECADLQLSEVKEILNLVERERIYQAQLNFAICDYTLYLNARPTNAKGALDLGKHRQAMRAASQIREQFTGQIQQKRNNFMQMAVQMGLINNKTIL
jgi:hypothetical protein